MKKKCDYCENELVYRQVAAFRVNHETGKIYRPICWACWRRYTYLQNDKTVRSVEFLEARNLLETEAEKWRKEDKWK